MISVRNLHKSYGTNKVLNGIDLDVAKGDVVAIIGPSGCGKSTFLRCLNLLEEPNAGQIRIAEKTLEFGTVESNVPTRFPDAVEAEFRSHAGMVFQQFHLFPHMTVLENVMEGPLTVKKMPKQDCEALAIKLLGKVGLSGKEDARPANLSGGSSNGWRLPALWRWNLGSCSLMNQPRRSTPNLSERFWPSCRIWRARAQPCLSSPMKCSLLATLRPM